MMKNRRGIIATIFFHGSLVVILAVFGFSTPLPLPAEQGIIVNFGTEETGFGAVEPSATEIPEEEEQVVRPAVTPVSPAEESNLVQDYEEAPAIEDTPADATETEENQPVEETQEQVTEEQAEEVTQVEEEPRKVNERALYRRNTDRTSTSESEGITQGEGNQGNPSGSPDADNYADVLSGDGGITWSLEGRNPVNLPKPEYNDQVSGTVVVRIRVDRNGKVTSAEAGVKGSTSTDKRLLDAAREAALKARFNSKPGAPLVQQGTLTYHFILQ